MLCAGGSDSVGLERGLDGGESEVWLGGPESRPAELADGSHIVCGLVGCCCSWTLIGSFLAWIKDQCVQSVEHNSDLFS